MHLLLISPNRERLPDPVVPSALPRLAAAVQHRHRVSGVDLCFDDAPLATLREFIERLRPDAVGISIRNLHTNLHDEAGKRQLRAWFAEVAATVRACTGAPLILGGSGYSLQPRSLLKELGADVGVVGEGERALLDILDELERGEPVVGLRGPGLPGSGDGFGSLDELPLPDLSMIDPRHLEYHGVVNVQTRRGCAFHCSYCTYPDIEGARVRTRAPELIADEFEAIAVLPGAQHVFIVDSVFNVPHDHALAVCDALIRRGNRLPWNCYLSPTSLTERLVERMAEAGCVGVEVGTDAGTNEVLRLLEKPFALKQVIRTRDALRASRIFDAHTFILGCPGETLEQSRATLDFVAELDPDVAIFMVWEEDRERMTLQRAVEHDALLDLLARRGPAHAGWVVPQLDLRFGDRLLAQLRRAGLRGVSWLHVAGARQVRFPHRAAADFPAPWRLKRARKRAVTRSST